MGQGLRARRTAQPPLAVTRPECWQTKEGVLPDVDQVDDWGDGGCLVLDDWRTMGCLHLGTRRPSIVDAARWVENVASRVRLGKVADVSTSFRDEKAKSDALCSAFPRACWAKWQSRRKGEGVGRIDMLPDQVKRERFDWCWAQSSQVLWQAMAAAKPSMSRANLSRGLDGNVCFSCCDSLASRGASAACSRSRGRGAAKSWSFGGHIRDQAGQPRCR